MSCNCLTGSNEPCSRSGSTKSGHNSAYCWQHQGCSKIFSGVRGATKKIQAAKAVVQSKSKIQTINPLQYKAKYAPAQAQAPAPARAAPRAATPQRSRSAMARPSSAPARARRASEYAYY